MFLMIKQLAEAPINQQEDDSALHVAETGENS